MITRTEALESLTNLFSDNAKHPMATQGAKFTAPQFRRAVEAQAAESTAYEDTFDYIRDNFSDISETESLMLSKHHYDHALTVAESEISDDISHVRAQELGVYLGIKWQTHVDNLLDFKNKLEHH